MKKIRGSQRQYDLLSKLYRVGGFCCILIILILFSTIIGKPIEFALLFLSYFATKGFYLTQYHAQALKSCFIQSIFVFIVAIVLCLNKYLSVLNSCLYGLILAYGSSLVGKVQFKLKDYDFIEPKYNELVKWYEQQGTIAVGEMTDDEFISYCQHSKLTDNEIKIANLIFRQELKGKELYNAIGYSKSQTIRIRERIKEAISCKGVDELSYSTALKVAQQELEHAMYWHDVAVQEIDIQRKEMIARNETIPQYMLDQWNEEHEEYVEKMAKLKYELEMVKK